MSVGGGIGAYAGTTLIYVVAAIAEIAGCFAFWAWLRLDRSVLWTVPGVVCLILFAWLLTRVEADAAGRSYAAYGGVYIAASLMWLWLVEQRAGSVGPDRSRDLSGRGRCDPVRPARDLNPETRRPR